MGLLLHALHERQPLPDWCTSAKISAADLKTVLRDFVRSRTNKLTFCAVSQAPLTPVDCRHGRPAEWALAFAKTAPQIPGVRAWWRA